MALIEINFISKCLMRTVTVNAIIPFDKISSEKHEGDFKTLYLLHGIFGNHTDWVSGTCVQRWAEEKNLAVIMPDGENHFYLDCEANGERYSQFIGEELPAKMEELFHLSPKREDKFIAGLSMGGYGAVMNGLKYHNNFSKVIGLSSAFHVASEDSNEFEEQLFGPYYHETIFGKVVKGTDKDPFWLLENIQENRPDLYLCCGLQDHLLKVNNQFAKKAKDLGYNVTYKKSIGGHDWVFWNTYIKKIIDWLPLDESKSGINSGNIR